MSCDFFVHTGHWNQQYAGPRRAEETHQKLQDERREREEITRQGAERTRETGQEEDCAVAPTKSYPLGH